MQLNEGVELALMVAYLTRNVVDGSFGHLRRKLKETDKKKPR